MCAAFLSLFVLHLERIRTETLLFSIISLAFAGLNLDVFLLGIITEPQTALMISRVDHFSAGPCGAGGQSAPGLSGVRKKRQMGHCLVSIRGGSGDGSVYAH
ncbi:MAG: hypothetical protein R2875_03160 [Desulfobacterales bacterium]